MKHTAHKLAILIVAFNEQKHIGRLLASIRALRQPQPIVIEAILIDGGSNDGTAAHARELGFDQVLEHPGFNIPACRNIALDATKANWLAFVDADCELDPGWLEAAWPLLDQPEALACGWPVAPPQPGTWVQRAWHIHWSWKNPRRESWNGHQVVRHEAFRLLTTRNLVFHRAVAQAIDGFDEALPTGEDTDFVFRAWQHGSTVLALPTLRVVHHGEPETLGEFYRQQLWHANRSSYQKILAAGGRTGGNAPRFTMLYLLTLLAALLGVGLGCATGSFAWLLLCLPWPTLIALPALKIGLRSGQAGAIPALCALYAAYGWARMLDLMGFHRQKPSWKA